MSMPVEVNEGTLAPIQPFVYAPTRAKISSSYHVYEELYENEKLGKQNFTKGVQVSPDGLCMLTNSEDGIMRLFEWDESEGASEKDHRSTLQMQEGGTVYDFTWYPYMTSQTPESCIFITTSRDQPVHMWDAYTGQLRATYRAYDHLDELAPANSVAFSTYGDKIFMGFDRMIRCFDITRPSRNFSSRPLSKTRRSREGQRGIISSIHFNPDQSKIYAAGSYAGTTYIYSEDEGEELLAMRDHEGRGITQVQFSPDGRLLCTAARRDGQLQLWDIRQTREVVYTLHRTNDTNQRLNFDFHCGGRYLVTGSQDGRVLLYDLMDGSLVDDRIQLSDATNGISFFPDQTRARVAVTTGQRHFELPEDMEDSDGEEQQTWQNTLQVFEYAKQVKEVGS